MNSVEIGGEEKYMVMRECGPFIETEVLRNHKRMSACDLIICVYDSSDSNSFAYLLALRVFS